MKTIAAFSFLAATTCLSACRSESEPQPDPSERNAVRAGAAHARFVQRIFLFANQDARIASNFARAEFGIPPMESEVRVTCDGPANAWIVQATEADMQRMESIAARFDQPGKTPWSKVP